MKTVGKGCLASIFILAVALTAAGFFWLQNSISQPKEAPEAEAVLDAQVDYPFQVLIPAYLPSVVDRGRVQIDTSQAGPGGEPMIRLVYPLPRGLTLELREWLPAGQDAHLSTGTLSGTTQAQILTCRCQMASQSECMMSDVELSVGPLRLAIQVSAANVFSMEQMQLIYNTLGPAANQQQVYSSMNDVPVTFSVPEAVEVPVNAEGVQEVDLIVTPGGYDPVHFAVQKDVPVRLTFRQIGYVSCGNELIFQWGGNQEKTLTLATPEDKQVLEFTPGETGEFPFHCPHYIYRGVMTVNE